MDCQPATKKKMMIIIIIIIMFIGIKIIVILTVVSSYILGDRRHKQGQRRYKATLKYKPELSIIK